VAGVGVHADMIENVFRAVLLFICCVTSTHPVLEVLQYTRSQKPGVRSKKRTGSQPSLGQARLRAQNVIGI
jgi:hypothetical protein